MEDRTICKICNKKFKTMSGLGRHTKLTHKLNPDIYYEKYLMPPKENECKICSGKTSFRNFSTGFLKYCSSKCCNLDPIINYKKKMTLFNRTGYIHNTHNPENKEKVKQTCLDRYGFEHYSKSDIVRNKTKKTCLDKYGFEYSMQSENNKIKSKATFLTKYGVDNYSKTDEFKKISLEKNLIYKKKFFESNILPEGYKISEYKMGKYIVLECDKGHIFECLKCLVRFRRGHSTVCTTCNPRNSGCRSKPEIDLCNFISSHYTGEIISSCRDIIPPLELDIYLPDLKLAFEFNGLYWHSELYKDKFYHLNKTEECERNGIQLIHIYQDDWEFKQDIIKSRILNLLGQSNKIYARKCDIREVSCKDTREFLEENHIQGTLNSNNNIGLYHNNELVSLMCFGKNRFKQEEEELLRFCNKIYTTVIGGASRLFKYYIKNNKKSNIISYADRNWSMGNLYNKLGFKLDSKTPPNYWYVNEYFRENRFKYRKSELIRMGFDPNKTEHEIMLDREMYRIYNAGNLKYKYIHNIQ
jgi:hypothetical protein